MKVIREYQRVSNYTNKNGHLLNQPFIIDHKYSKKVVITVYKYTKQKVRYIPFIAKNRPVEVKYESYYYDPWPSISFNQAYQDMMAFLENRT